MLDPDQFRSMIIRPTLVKLDLWSEAAENLIIGTAAQESGLRYLKQLGNGPALGLYQCEPATHADIYTHFLSYREELKEKVIAFLVPNTAISDNLVFNMWYSTAICRIHYLRVQAKLPEKDDIQGLAHYYKKFYNTAEGKASEDEFAYNYQSVIS